MTIFLSGDLHIDHARIIEYCKRPFNSLTEMQEELIARFNSRVSPDDELWILGDFSMGEKIVPIILPRFNGRKILVSGNHDAVHPCRKKHEAATQRYLLYGFEGIHQEVHNFHGFLLNHLPRAEDGEHGKKFAQWRPQKHVWETRADVWQLHGHTHLPPDKRVNAERRMIDVGVDGNNFYPISLDEIKEIVERERLKEKTGTQL